jgi:hypothetical protein
MSKYNLIDLFEGMSNDEFEAAKEADRLEAHPERDKIKAIQALIAKEREKIIKQGGIKEMTGEAYDRIDGLTNQVLKQQFLLKFSEIYEDMVEAGDMFDVSDVIQYLTSQMQEFAADTKMDQGGMMESTGPSDKSEPEDDVDNVDTLASPDAKGKGYDSAVKATSDQDNEEERDDAGVPPMYTEAKRDKFSDLVDKDDDIPADKKAIWAKVYRMLDKGATFDQVKKYISENEDEITKLQKIADDTSKMPKERDEARNKMYDLKRQKESMGNANDLGKKLSQVMFKLQDDPKEYVKLYMDSVARDIQRGDKAQYDEMSVEDMIEDYQNYIADKSMAELKDHFGRFMKDFQ